MTQSTARIRPGPRGDSPGGSRLTIFVTVAAAIAAALSALVAATLALNQWLGSAPK